MLAQGKWREYAGGSRGGIFQLVEARVNIRLNNGKLMVSTEESIFPCEIPYILPQTE